MAVGRAVAAHAVIIQAGCGVYVVQVIAGAEVYGNNRLLKIAIKALRAGAKQQYAKNTGKKGVFQNEGGFTIKLRRNKV